MRPIRWLTLIAVAATVSIAAGCGGGETTVTVTVTEAEQGSAPAGATGPEEGEVPAPEDVQSGTLGDKFEIEGETTDLDAKPIEVALTIRLSDLEDPAEADVPPGEIEPGTRWVRATADLTNKADDPFDSDLTQWELIDSKDQAILGNDVTPIGPQPQLSGTLSPGDRRTGAVVFLIDENVGLKEVRFGLLGDGTGPRWELP